MKSSQLLCLLDVLELLQVNTDHGNHAWYSVSCIAPARRRTPRSPLAPRECRRAFGPADEHSGHTKASATPHKMRLAKGTWSSMSPARKHIVFTVLLHHANTAPMLFPHFSVQHAFQCPDGILYSCAAITFLDSLTDLPFSS